MVILDPFLEENTNEMLWFQKYVGIKFVFKMSLNEQMFMEKKWCVSLIQLRFIIQNLK